MIINDAYKFAFIHIPKCAGTSARQFLQRFDETGGQFTSRVDLHPDLGSINYVHIPLFVLRQYFSKEYKKLCEYSTFALLRDPFARFPSSMAQHLKDYSTGGIYDLSQEKVLEKVEQVVVCLEKHASPQTLLPKEYIHFQRQIDYVQDGDRYIVDNIFNCGQLSSMLMEICGIAGLDIRTERCEFDQMPHINRSVTARNPIVGKVYDLTCKFAGPHVNLKTKKKLIGCLKNLIFVPWQKKLSRVFQSKRVIDFIQHYYEEDIALYSLKKNTKR